MKTGYKSKAIATVLAAFLGASGAHRFYLHGIKDAGGWLYLCASLVYLAALVPAWSEDRLGTSVIALFPLPAFAAVVEALAIGLTNDENWNARYNLFSARRTKTGWPLVTLLILLLAGSYVVFIACMARATDLLYTNGAFG